MSIKPVTRDDLLQLPDAQLLAQCRVARCLGTGPGGQKRNKTATSVTVTHEASGYSGSSDATRSQSSNQAMALRHLRQEVALQWRQVPSESWNGAWKPGSKQPLYSVWVAWVLDVLHATEFKVSDAAAYFGVSTGKFTRDLAQDTALWQAVNDGRRRHLLPLLRCS